jgi:hypothetical protein
MRQQHFFFMLICLTLNNETQPAGDDNMQTPDVIYLIDTGDEISWCDDPNPSGDLEPDDVVKYIKATPKALAAPDMLEALKIARDYIYSELQEKKSAYGDRLQHKIKMVQDDLDKVDEAIKKANG